MTTSENDDQSHPDLLPPEREAPTKSSKAGVDVPVIWEEHDNLARHRQLNTQQKRQVIEAYLRADPAINDNQLGNLIGVSKNTVAAVRRHLESTCQIDKLTEFRGRDGKVRPRKYHRIIANTKEMEVAQTVANEPRVGSVHEPMANQAADQPPRQFRVISGHLDLWTTARTPREAALWAIHEAAASKTIIAALMKVETDEGRFRFYTPLLLEQLGYSGPDSDADPNDDHF